MFRRLRGRLATLGIREEFHQSNDRVFEVHSYVDVETKNKRQIEKFQELQGRDRLLDASWPSATGVAAVNPALFLNAYG